MFTLQTLPACDPEDQFGDTVGKVAGFSLHAGVAAKAHERNKLERLCLAVAPRQRQFVGLLWAIALQASVAPKFTADRSRITTNDLGNLSLKVTSFLERVNLVSFLLRKLRVAH